MYFVKRDVIIGVWTLPLQKRVGTTDCSWTPATLATPYVITNRTLKNIVVTTSACNSCYQIQTYEIHKQKSFTFVTFLYQIRINSTIHQITSPKLNTSPNLEFNSAECEPLLSIVLPSNDEKLKTGIATMP